MYIHYIYIYIHRYDIHTYLCICECIIWQWCREKKDTSIYGTTCRRHRLRSSTHNGPTHNGVKRGSKAVFLPPNGVLYTNRVHERHVSFSNVWNVSLSRDERWRRAIWRGPKRHGWIRRRNNISCRLGDEPKGVMGRCDASPPHSAMLDFQSGNLEITINHKR